MSRTLSTWYRFLGLLIVAAMLLPPSTLADAGTPAPEPDSVGLDQPGETEPPVPVSTEPPASTEPVIPMASEPIATEPPTPVSTEDPGSLEPVFSALNATFTLAINGQTGTAWIPPLLFAQVEASPTDSYTYQQYLSLDCQGPIVRQEVTTTGVQMPPALLGTAGSWSATNASEETACVSFFVGTAPPPTPTPAPIPVTLTINGQTGTAWIPPLTTAHVEASPEGTYEYFQYTSLDCQGAIARQEEAATGVTMPPGLLGTTGSWMAIHATGTTACVNYHVGNAPTPTPTPIPPPSFTLTMNGESGTVLLPPQMPAVVAAVPQQRYLYRWYAAMDCQGPARWQVFSETGAEVQIGEPGEIGSFSATSNVGTIHPQETDCVNYRVIEDPTPPQSPTPGPSFRLYVAGQTGTALLGELYWHQYVAMPEGTYTYRRYETMDCQGEGLDWEFTTDLELTIRTNRPGSISATNTAGETDCVNYDVVRRYEPPTFPIPSFEIAVNGQTGTAWIPPHTWFNARALPVGEYAYFAYPLPDCQGDDYDWLGVSGGRGGYTWSGSSGTVMSILARSNRHSDSTACINIFVSDDPPPTSPPTTTTPTSTPPPTPPVTPTSTPSTSFTLTIDGRPGPAWLQPNSDHLVQALPPGTYTYRFYTSPDCQGTALPPTSSATGFAFTTGATGSDGSIWATNASGTTACISFVVREGPSFTLAIDGRTGTALLQPHTDYPVQALPQATYTYHLFATLDCEGTGVPLATTATAFTLTTGGPGPDASILATNAAGEIVCINISIYDEPTPTPVPPTNTPTAEPTATSTSVPPTPTETPVPPINTPVPTVTGTPAAPTSVPTDVPTATATGTLVAPTPTQMPTNTPMPPTPTGTATATSAPPTSTAIPTETPMPPTVTAEPTAIPTETPAPPTTMPTNAPTATGTSTLVPPTSTLIPTATPTIVPTNTLAPPTPTPTNEPTTTAVATSTPMPPTSVPTDAPTATTEPTGIPTAPATSTLIPPTATATEMPPTTTPTSTATPTETPEVLTALPNTGHGPSHRPPGPAPVMLLALVAMYWLVLSGSNRRRRR